MRAVASATALALLLSLAAASGASPATDPDWHIPLATDLAAPLPAAGARVAEALDRYRQLADAGGWPAVPADRPLRPGVRDPAVAALRNRLRAGGDYAGAAGTADAWLYDVALQRSVEAFQARHGLPATGAADRPTLAALNVSAADRVAQLEATLTRWRWLPRDPGNRYLWVNVPAGSLELVEDGAPTLAMRVIAGHPDRPTPSFEDRVEALVINPAWSVPRTIAVEDLLPSQQEDPGFLARLGIRVLDGAGRPVNPQRVAWNELGPDRFPYRLVQQPGPLNSLGHYKFVLTNPWDIYLHDTPSRRLFDLNSRTLSSGCIRLEQPEELARRLVAGTSAGKSFPGESSPRVSPGKDFPDGGPADAPRTRTLKLPDPIKLYVVYLTSWVTPDGVVQFRPDVYGRDARLR